MAGVSPTQNSLKLLREKYEIVAVVEWWNSFTRRRHDLFGVWDIIAVGNGEVCLVQTTSYSNVSARIRKIEGNECLAPLRKAGVRLEVHGWRKVNNRWQPRIVDIS